MNTISASFEIIDNTGQPYSSNVFVIKPKTSDIMNEIKSKIMRVYRLNNIEQIVTITNIVTT